MACVVGPDYRCGNQKDEASHHNALGRLPLKVIVPVTDWKERYLAAAWMVNMKPTATNNLTKESAADCFQIRSVAEERLLRKMGQVDSDTIEKIRSALSIVLSLA